MAARGADILDVGLVSSVGLTAATTAAAVRAGVCRFHDSPVLGRDFEPVVMGIVPTAELPALAPAFDERRLGTRRARMLRLAGRALRECLERVSDPAGIPVLLAVPDSHFPYPDPEVVDQTFLDELSVQAELRFDLARSRLFPRGRAGAFFALREALERLCSGAEERVVVGGVDSYLDALLLSRLEHEGRILGAFARDGFIPGEGAGFLLLARAAKKGDPRPLARIDAVANALEPGHRYSNEPYLGDGLDAAFRQLFEALPGMDPARTVYAGLNGESFNAKEWGVACVRHRGRLAEDFAIEHPVDCFGDPGAALGAMMTILAAIGVHRGYRRSPCLLWCSSDRAERGAAVVSAV